jgi:ubiquinone/menaquinone biosynthesis C-methylase UbiE
MDVEYVIGRRATDLDQLLLRASFLRPGTEQMFRMAGIRPGMRVLDIGSGIGDVSLLAASLVGQLGLVVGLDRDAAAVALAEYRTRGAGYSCIRFRAEALEDFNGDGGPFDAVVGRYVLGQQADPAGFLRNAARHLVPSGGVVAFHEADWTRSLRSAPEVPFWDQTLELLGRAMRSLPHANAGAMLVTHFCAAGLPVPEIHGHFLAGGGADFIGYQVAAESIRSVVPVLAEIGIPVDEIGIDTLEDRLRAAVVAAGAQVESPREYMAVARL